MPKKPCAFQGCTTLVDIGSRYCARHAAQDKKEAERFDYDRRAEVPWRKWYKRAAWCGPTGRRASQLRREPLCALCPPDRPTPATIADHVIPHRGDHGLFWFGELQSLCKTCHDVKKQREERRVQPRGEGSKSGASAAGTGVGSQIFSRGNL